MIRNGFLKQNLCKHREWISIYFKYIKHPSFYKTTVNRQLFPPTDWIERECHEIGCFKVTVKMHTVEPAAESRPF
jgi:hypothetical protein